MSSIISPRTSTTRRPTTPKGTPLHGSNAAPDTVPPLPNTANIRKSTSAAHPPRRSSLAFLRRSKSGDPIRKAPVVAPAPPKLPDLFTNDSTHAGEFPAQLLTEDISDSSDVVNAAGAQEAPTTRKTAQNGNGGYVSGRKSTDSVIREGALYVKSSPVPITEDPYANVGSMAHRGRYSYASSAVSTAHRPRRVRRRKDPTPFNVMVVGAKNSGKTSFTRFLRQSLALRGKADDSELLDTDHTGTTADSGFKSSYIETEIDGERIGLTLWDSAGLEKSLIDLQIREMTAFIENKFEETFAEETKVVRSPGVLDTHIHCVFLLLDPARLAPNNQAGGKAPTVNGEGGLDKSMDIAVLQALKGKTVVVPIISKADICTTKHMEHLKNIVREGLARADLDPLEPLELELASDEDESNRSRRDSREDINESDDRHVPCRGSSSDGSDEGSDLSDAESGPMRNTLSAPGMTAGLTFVPLSIISPDSYGPDLPLGRHFPWGFADPFNPGHCDFSRLKDSVFGEWRAELREKSRINWYENWRSERLGAAGRVRRQ